jgi:hypothetical protein
VREEALIRAMGGEEWPFQASFPSGLVQTEQQFQARTYFKPGQTDPAGMAPGTGHSGKTERALSGARRWKGESDGQSLSMMRRALAGERGKKAAWRAQNSECSPGAAASSGRRRELREASHGELLVGSELLAPRLHRDTWAATGGCHRARRHVGTCGQPPSVFAVSRGEMTQHFRPCMAAWG